MAGEEMHLALQKSEQTVIAAASRFYASYIVKGVIIDSNEDEYIEKCVRMAMKMALKADKLVLSDDELGG